jgi:DNA-binding phage protein
MCIETGVRRGLNKAFKHDDEPSMETISNCLEECIQEELMQFFDMEDQ